MYRIDQIKKVIHEDGRKEIIVCDGTLELIAFNLDKMGLSLPLNEEKDEDTLWEYLSDLDVEIGQVESEKIYPTREYDELVCRAVDEFNLEEDEYIDYDDINERLSDIIKRIKSGTYVPIIKEKYMKEQKGSNLKKRSA